MKKNTADNKGVCNIGADGITMGISKGRHNSDATPSAALYASCNHWEDSLFTTGFSCGFVQRTLANYRPSCFFFTPTYARFQQSSIFVRSW